MKTLSSIKQIVGKAVGRYNRDQHNDCAVRVESIGNGSFVVHTRVANGDRVPWARKPMNYVWNALNRHGIKCDFSRNVHSCGSVSDTFTQSI